MPQTQVGTVHAIKNLSWQLILLTAVLAFILAAAGCRSTSDAGTGSFASVLIEGHSASEVADAVVKVFAADGYQGGMVRQGEFVFEKFASRGTSFSREGFANAYYGQRTINRVRLNIISLAGGKHRVECTAYMVTGGSDPFFQSEVPLAHIRRAPYQALLNKVAKELK
jgi:hypothetical protein